MLAEIKNAPSRDQIDHLHSLLAPPGNPRTRQRLEVSGDILQAEPETILGCTRMFAPFDWVFTRTHDRKARSDEITTQAKKREQKANSGAAIRARLKQLHREPEMVHVMKRVISISRIVDSHEVTRGTREVIASAEAMFDEAKTEFVVDLDSKAVITDAHGHETRVTEDWLPPRQTIREHMPFSDAPDAAREIFDRWAGKVRDAIPDLVPS